MTVKEMSKKTAIGIAAILVVISIADFIQSAQNGKMPWIGRYMERHYPELILSLETSLSSDTTASVAEVEDSPEMDELEIDDGEDGPFDADGFVFPDSNEAYLTEDDLYELQYFEDYEFKDLLGFARNEIYARHGFQFNENGKYHPFYSQYEWYNELEHGDVSEDELNEYELQNVSLIVRIETEEGF